MKFPIRRLASACRCVVHVRSRRLGRLALGALLGLSPAVAWACSGNYATFSRGGFNVTVNNPAAANGTVLGSSTVNATGGNGNWTRCFGPITVAGTTAYNGTYGTYATAIPGIGMRMTIAAGGQLPASGNDNGSGRWTLVGGNMTIQLIKTGNITTGGTISAGAIAYGRFTTYGVNAEEFRLTSGINVTVPNPTCAFSINGGRDVNLGRHNANIFTGAGVGASPWVEFPTLATCNASTSQIHLTYRGAANANNSGLFAVTGLSGVGVQLQRVPGNSAITPNSTARQTWTGIGSVQNLWHRARFLQTLPTVSEGTGRASITLNVTYN